MSDTLNEFAIAISDDEIADLGDRRSRVQISAVRQINILFEQAFRRSWDI